VIGFPAYVPKAVERQLCRLTEGTFITEDERVKKVDTWESVKKQLFDENALVLSHRLRRAPWLPAAVADQDVSVLVNRRTIAGIRVRNPKDRRQYRWIVPVGSWFQKTAPSQSDIRTLRSLVAYVGVGVQPTPSALGQTLMRQFWQGETLPRPRLRWWRVFHQNIVGGRVDSLKLQTWFSKAYGLDVRSAYVAAARRIPAGNVVWFYGRPPAGLATYYQHLQTYVDRSALGPLPVRETTGLLRYPDGCELCDGWYWKEEEGDAIERGGETVWRGIGLGFEGMSSALEPWAVAVHALRQGAAAPDVAALVKQCGVSALGRLGADVWSTRLVSGAGAADLWTDEGYDGSGPEYGLETAYHPGDGSQVQVASYVHMQVRRQLWAKALPYAEEGSLIATNYDELLSEREPAPEPAGEALGTWKLTAYDDLRVPYPRAKLAQGVAILPGWSRSA
jgi:hypothetical protein